MRLTWLWGRSHSPTSRAAQTVVRALLLPASGFYWLVSRAVQTYRSRHCSKLPLPSVVVGEMSVGGAGKTPVVKWLAVALSESGIRPAVVTRGYGGDEELELRDDLEDIPVIRAADRASGAVRALELGAECVVFDDGLQRPDYGFDIEVALVSASRLQAPRWTLPAGPWRESVKRIERATYRVLTHRIALTGTVSAAFRRIAGDAGHELLLSITGFETLAGEPLGDDVVRGARVLAMAGIADPESFFGQLAERGAVVTSWALSDHHRYSSRTVESALHKARWLDYVVVTKKDAVKLRDLWPAGGPRVLVAVLGVAGPGAAALRASILDGVRLLMCSNHVGSYSQLAND
ncbi:MAG: tetraacyldisaccharide 4'-kinase [Gemmatimonadales bacterium]